MRVSLLNKLLILFVFTVLLGWGVAFLTNPQFLSAAGIKIFDMTELTSGPADGDLLVVVDISDTSMASSGTTKKMQKSNFAWNDGEISDTITVGASGVVSDAAIPSAVTRDTEHDTWAEQPALTQYYIVQGNASNQPAATNSINIAAIDLGGGTSFEPPNSANPTTDAEGELAWDSDDDAIEVYNGSSSVLIASLYSETITLAEPDQLQPIADAWQLYHFPAERFPHGVTIVDIIITSSATCTDALNFEEWSNNGSAWSTDATVEAITLSGTRTEDDGTLADAAIAADAYLFVDLPATPTDIASIDITFTYTITEGN